MTLDFVADISTEIRAWTDMFLSRKDKKTKLESEALGALISTLNDTVKYIAAVNKNPEEKSEKKDHELSALWENTSIKVRPYKPDLAQKCFFKGLSWADQSRYQEEDIIALGITISDMEKEVTDAIKSI